jgi:type IV secretory pathway VirD2 relaxase
MTCADFTRELMIDMAKDLGTKLDWVAVDHWNTDNPHIHILVRGVAERRHRPRHRPSGYISDGLRRPRRGARNA